MSALADALADLTDDELATLHDTLETRYGWRETARDDQLVPDGKWRVWYVRGGRGGGKTWTGAHNLAEMIVASPPGEWAVVAPTFGDARDTCMESTKSGLIRALGGKPGPGGVLIEKGPYIDRWNRSMGHLFLTDGSVVYADGADDGALRIQGRNLRGAWCDEIGLWKRWATAWDESLRYAVRDTPALIIATGTPKRNMPAKALVKRLLEDDAVRKSLLLTRDNADNLDPAALEDLLSLSGTTLGRQELEGELLEDVDGALWTPDMLDGARVSTAPECDRIVVAVDPAGTAFADSDETGIIVAARADGQGFVLGDLSGRYSPDGWGKRVCRACVDYEADAVVFERNNGHDMGPHIIRSSWAELARDGEVTGPAPRIVEVWAKHGKVARAEPLVAQYEQGLWHHVGRFDELERQLCDWTPGSGSPDRMDALVWAAWELTVKLTKRGGLRSHTEPNDGLVTAAAKKLYRKEETPRSGRGMRVRY